MRTFDDESFVLENYRLTPSRKIKFCGRFFHCWRIIAENRKACFYFIKTEIVFKNEFQIIFFCFYSVKSATNSNWFKENAIT